MISARLSRRFHKIRIDATMCKASPVAMDMLWTINTTTDW